MAFLGTVITGQKLAWTANIRVGEKDVSFKLDTGAEVTVLSETAYHSLGKVKLQKPTTVLYGPAQQSLRVMGKFTAELSHKAISATQTIFVIRGLKNNLLGLPAITSLNLLQQVEEMYTEGSDPLTQFPKVFSGLGNLGEAYEIKLKEDAAPRALFTPRRVPIPLRPKVQAELDRMEALGVISRVTDPTPWCAGMVVVPKRSGAVRICVDLKPLNESVCREVHPIPKVDETLAQLAGAVRFSKLDANSGFWQIPLEEKSRPLTTFITPFGRYCFNKLPFGISSAPELFQRRMMQILEGLDGIVCLMDDVLVFGSSQAQHDARLNRVMRRIEAAGVTLNREKCEFNKERLSFLGHLIDKDGIRADPEKTAAVIQMAAPQNITELRRFMGMINQLAKFSPRLAELSKPLRDLLSTKRAWLWGADQERAFAEVKAELAQPTVLALYDPEAETKISADASSFGLGAVLLQQSDETWRPVVYASRALNETECRYAQIEKEALAVTWASEKFSDYVLGRRFQMETDHKPLIPLLSTKHLDSLPPRVLRFRLRLARFDYSIHHVPGKLLYVADALSRAPTSGKVECTFLQPDEVETFVQGVVAAIPATEQRLKVYQVAQAQDAECARVMEYCKAGWPKKAVEEHNLASYWKARASLTVCNDLLLYDDRIVVPLSLRKETLQRIHDGHQGVERCRVRAKAAVWWPHISREIADMVKLCPTCAKDASQRREPLKVSPLPEYPWQVIGTDLFEFRGEHYILVVDYFSRYPEIIKLRTTTSAAIIVALKTILSRHGIPETIRSDNGLSILPKSLPTLCAHMQCST